MVFRTRWGASIGERSTKTTPSGKSFATSAAAAMARRVLPTPPGPVKVSRRTAGSRTRETTAASSWSRAIRSVNGRGRDPRRPSVKALPGDTIRSEAVLNSR